jgi:hypothetical protein
MNINNPNGAGFQEYHKGWFFKVLSIDHKKVKYQSNEETLHINRSNGKMSYTVFKPTVQYQ